MRTCISKPKKQKRLLWTRLKTTLPLSLLVFATGDVVDFQDLEVCNVLTDFF